jgi:hypothetical protein
MEGRGRYFLENNWPFWDIFFASLLLRGCSRVACAFFFLYFSFRTFFSSFLVRIYHEQTDHFTKIILLVLPSSFSMTRCSLRDSDYYSGPLGIFACLYAHALVGALALELRSRCGYKVFTSPVRLSIRVNTLIPHCELR